MKNKILYLLFIAGFVTVIAGAYMKIEHYEYASFILVIGLALECGAVGSFFVKLLRMKKGSL
jgi:ferritin-like metal-binding protein YciE